MMWNFVRGFLPCTDPVQTLTVKESVYLPLVQTVEGLAAYLVKSINDGTVREEIVYGLREVIPLFDHGLFDAFGSPAMDERAFLLYGYLAAVFVNNHVDKPVHRLAKEITIPIVRLAERVQRKPVLDYTSYILYNWRRKNQSQPLTADNLEPLLTFSDTEEEKRYIVCRVAMESKAACLSAQVNLEDVSDYLSECVEIIKLSPQMPKQVLTYFADFSGVWYEGWPWPDPQTFAGNVLTQSSTIAKVARILGLPYNDAEIMDHKPVTHRGSLSSTRNLRRKCSVYDDCLGKFCELVEFMSQSQVDFWSRLGRTKEQLLAESRV